MSITLRSLVPALILAASAACSAPSAPQNQAATGVGGGVLPAGNAQAAAAARSPCESAAASCSGPLIVRAERATLTTATGDINTTVSAALTIANRSGEEVRIVLVDPDAVLTLDNGATVSTDTWGWTGIPGCRGRSGQGCLEGSPDQSLTLRPGDSPVQLTPTLGSQVPDALRATLPNAAKATLTFTLFVSGRDGARQVQVSVADIPVTNQIAR